MNSFQPFSSSELSGYYQYLELQKQLLRSELYTKLGFIKAKLRQNAIDVNFTFIRNNFPEDELMGYYLNYPFIQNQADSLKSSIKNMVISKTIRKKLNEVRKHYGF